AQVPYRVRHTTEFLLAQVPRVQFTVRAERTVAVHAHVVGEARQREARACRELLASVPGLRVVPLPSEPRLGRSCAPAIPIALGQDVWYGLVRDEIWRAPADGAGTLPRARRRCHALLRFVRCSARTAVPSFPPAPASAPAAASPCPAPARAAPPRTRPITGSASRAARRSARPRPSPAPSSARGSLSKA